MEAGYSYDVPTFVSLVDANVVPERNRAVTYIMEIAGKAKGFSPPPFETATTETAAMAAEIRTNYSVKDAVRVFNQIPVGDTNSRAVLEFQSIVGKLPMDDLRSLIMFLEGTYYSMMLMPGHSYCVPGHASPVYAHLAPDRLRAVLGPMKRKNIMKMAGKVKGFTPALFETATTEAAVETNYSTVEDAARAFRRMSGNSGVLEFQSIVGKLPMDDLQTLEKLLEEQYYMMLRSEMGPDGYPAGSGGGDNFAMGQAIAVMLTNVVGSAVFGAFPISTNLKPLEKAAGAVGLMSVIGGMVLQVKKPGLARAMLKFGSVAIALAMILPMAVNLNDVVMSWIFGVIAFAIVAITVTFA